VTRDKELEWIAAAVGLLREYPSRASALDASVHAVTVILKAALFMTATDVRLWDGDPDDPARRDRSTGRQRPPARDWRYLLDNDPCPEYRPPPL
jgi:hypothetical protein